MRQRSTATLATNVVLARPWALSFLIFGTSPVAGQSRNIYMGDLSLEAFENSTIMRLSSSIPSPETMNHEAGNGAKPLGLSPPIFNVTTRSCQSEAWEAMQS
jgi:hypothetical protein